MSQFLCFRYVMAMMLSTEHVITALGIRFWMKAMEDLGITSDVTKCMNLSQYLQSVISNNQQVKIHNNEENVENDDLFLVCFSYGVQFWQKVMIEHSILEVNHCKTVLDFFQRVINEYDLNGVETEEKPNLNRNRYHDLNNDFFDNSTPNSPEPSHNVLIKFKKKNKEPISKGFKCEYCEKAFGTFRQAETHMERKHPDLKDEFDKKNLLFKCERGCDKVFNSFKALVKHYKWAHSSSITKCEYCPEQSVSPFLAVKHLKEAHPEMKSEFDAKFRVHKCTEEGCVKSYLTGKGLQKHRRRFHRGDKEDDNSSSTLCADCGVSFLTFKELKRHKKTHNRREVSKKPKVRTDTPKPCNLCGETFIGNYKLSVHRFKVHDVGAFFCDDCGEKFLRLRNFEAHKQRMHMKVTFDCNLCGKSFNIERNLNRHMKRVHTSNDERKYKCNQCGKGFACKETYVGHMNMHLGLKPFKCQYCGAGYQNPSNLLAHLKKSCKNNPNL